MANIGEILIRAREAFPDPPNVLTPPVAGFSGNNSGGSLGAGDYYCIVTALNIWGESAGSAELKVTFASGTTNSLNVAPTLPPGTVSFRAYLSTTPSGEIGYLPSVGLNPFTLGGGTQIQNLSGLTGGQPPTRSSAWLPDTDGGFVTAATMYRWLNDALQAMGRIAGGLASVTGIQAIANQAMFRVSGLWIRFTNFWFDGWPLTSGHRGDVFLHNKMSSISGIVTLEEWTDTTVIQLWPQPNRTGANSTVNGSMNIGQTSLTTHTDMGALGLLPLGMLKVDQEIMSYSGYTVAAGNTTITGIVRGLSGTQEVNHTDGSNVLELNVRMAGFRNPVFYSIGQAATSIPLVPGWEVPLATYILAQYKKAEQDMQTAKALEDEFGGTVTALAAQFRGKTHPVQIGSITRETYPGGYGGGLLVP